MWSTGPSQKGWAACCVHPSAIYQQALRDKPAWLESQGRLCGHFPDGCKENQTDHVGLLCASKSSAFGKQGLRGLPENVVQGADLPQDCVCRCWYSPFQLPRLPAGAVPRHFCWLRISTFRAFWNAACGQSGSRRPLSWVLLPAPDVTGILGTVETWLGSDTKSLVSPGDSAPTSSRPRAQQAPAEAPPPLLHRPPLFSAGQFSF